VRCEFLPPYSPDYNPIELSFSAIKARIRREGERFRIAETDGALISLLHEVVNSVSTENAHAWFAWSGYEL
ncbi:hypothetical protein BS47DRAFT_1302127, partial [Hydnum rufescens UP504]